MRGGRRLASGPDPLLARSTMPPAATPEGDALGSRAPALRRGRSSTAMPTTTAQPMTLMRTRRQSSSTSQSAQEPLVRSKRKGKAAGNQRSNKRKRTREEAEEERDEKKEREEEEVSSAGSSPLRAPYIPDEMYLIEDSDVEESIMKAQDDYSAKLARQRLLPTLYPHNCRPPTCMVKDPKLLRVRESATKTVLSAAPCIIGISSSVGGHLLARCSGFWVDWNKDKSSGTVLTTAHVIRTKTPSLDDWLGKDEYAPDAEVFVHLWDDPTEKKGHQAHLLYHQKHYNIALFEVRVDQPVQFLRFNDDVKCGEKVFELGRDENSFLTIRHGMVQDGNSNLLERYHYLYVHGANENLKYDNGGPVIDFHGKVVGMVSKSTDGSFIPSSVLLKCWNLWNKFGRILRPQLRMKFSAIKFLDPPLIEKILCKCNTADGLIVEEVSEGSRAEKLGFRLGDVIQCLDGERISTTVELENVLLSKCKDGISGLTSEMDLEIRVFHIRRNLWRSKKLTVEVSDDSEVIVRGESRHQRRSFSEASALGPCASPPRLMDNSTAKMDQSILSSLKTRMKSWNSGTKKLPTDAEVMERVLNDVGRDFQLNLAGLKDRIKKYESMVQKHLDSEEHIVENKDVLLQVFSHLRFSKHRGKLIRPDSASSEKRSRDEHDDSANLENAKKATYSESVGKQPTGLGSAQNETDLSIVSGKLERSLSGTLLCKGLDLVKKDPDVRSMVLGLSDKGAGKYVKHCLNN